MENGKITNNEISASSVYNSNTGASRARLNFIPSGGVSGGWVAAADDDKSTLTITFSYPFTRVTGIATQGRQDASEWVKTYRLKYSKPNGEKGFYQDPGETLYKVSLDSSQVAHQTGDFLGFCSMKQEEYYSPLNGILVFCRVTTTIKFTAIPI